MANSCVRLCTTSYIDDGVVSNRSVSSELSAFPSDNLFNRQRRGKLWRSEGYFLIDSTNKSIVFRETLAVDLTATIAEDEYLDITTFMAAVKTALEIAGSSVYTVTQDVDLRINIASDRAGGGGIFELRNTDAGFTAADILGFDTSASLSDDTDHTADFIRIHTEEYVLFDLGVPTNPNAFVMTALRNEAIQLSPNATIKLQGNQTNNFTGTVAFEQTVTFDDEYMFLLADDDAAGLHTEGLRYWRVQFIDKDNSDGYIQMGAVFLGDQFLPTRGRAVFPLSSGFVDRSNTVLAESGVTFTDIRQGTQEFNLRWRGLTKSEFDELRLFIEEVKTGLPFFVIIDSKAAFSIRVNRNIKYCKIKAPPRWELISPNNISMEITIREEL